MLTFFLKQSTIYKISAIVSLTCLIQITLCLPLFWLDKTRTFPLIAAFDFFINLFSKEINNIFFLLLSGLIFVAGWAKNKQYVLISILVLFTIFIFQDVNKLQAWVYQYMLIWFAAYLSYYHTNKETNKNAYSIFLIQMVFIATYLWAGLNKLNIHYLTSVFNWLICIFEWTKPLKNNLLLAYCSVFIEIAVGLGLMFNKTKKLAVLLACTMHFIILVLLIKDGWNTVVYPWNVGMAAGLYILFWEEKVSFDIKKYGKNISLYIYIFLLFIAPIFNIFGYWQYNLSNTMYSGISLEIEMVASDKAMGCFSSKFNNGEIYGVETDSSFIFDLDDWVLYELNVPYYAESWIVPYFQKKYCPCLKQYNGFIRLEKTYRWDKNKEKTLIPCD